MHDVREHAGSLAVPVRHEPQRCTVFFCRSSTSRGGKLRRLRGLRNRRIPSPAADKAGHRHWRRSAAGSTTARSRYKGVLHGFLRKHPNRQPRDWTFHSMRRERRQDRFSALLRTGRAGGPGTRTQATWSDPESESGRKPSPERDKRSNALILRLCLHRPAERCHAPTWTDRNRLVRGPARATAAPENQQPAGAGIRKFAVPKKLPGRNEPRAGGGDEGIRTLEAVSRLLP